ncbi:MAG: hypothetical protein MRJ92_02425 [Nitrospira sp.]|nr:hypothetical protein [Nitrospira sp.]
MVDHYYLASADETNPADRRGRTGASPLNRLGLQAAGLLALILLLWQAMPARALDR